jgi:hypothetical protein
VGPRQRRRLRHRRCRHTHRQPHPLHQGTY